LSRRWTIAYLLALCLLLTGCGERLLERSYSSVLPHSAAYRETESANTLRAENYPDLVNALLMLLGDHSETGAVRIYGDAPDKAQLAEDACVEVQKETALGAYLLDYITYEGKAESGYYELTVRFGYRRTAEELSAIVNATSAEALPDLLRAAIDEGRDAVAIRFGYRRTAEELSAIVNATSAEALPDLLRAAIDEGRDAVAIRFGYLGGGRESVTEQVEIVHREVYPPEPAEEAFAEPTEEPVEDEAVPPEPAEEETPYDLAPWQVLFYPNDEKPGIVEVLLLEKPDA